jgi:DNA-binding LytR/AlgR family response regulator
MMFRVFVAVSHETEQSLYAKLLPTTRDQLQIVTRAATNRPLTDQLRSAADVCDIVVYDPSLDSGAALAIWLHSEPRAVLCCWCTDPGSALECMKAGPVFVLTNASSAVDVDIAFRRCTRLVRSASSNAMIAKSPIAEYAPDVVALPHLRGIEVRSCESIVHVEGQGNYTNVVFAREPKLMLSRTIGDYEEILSGAGFIRVHRSHIVNMRHVRRIIPGKIPRIVLTNGDVVSVSDRYREMLMSKLNIIKRK